MKLSATPTPGDPLAVYFVADLPRSAEASIDFGDGSAGDFLDESCSTSSESVDTHKCSVWHTYQAGGTYTATLIDEENGDELSSAAVAVIQSATSHTTTVDWSFIDAGQGQYGIPYNTKVAVIVYGHIYEPDTYDAVCREVVSGEKDMYGQTALPNQLSPRAECWYAGGGYEFGVFQEGSKLFAKVATLYEGSSETPGGKTDFETLVEID